MKNKKKSQELFLLSLEMKKNAVKNANEEREKETFLHQQAHIYSIIHSLEWSQGHVVSHLKKKN